MDSGAESDPATLKARVSYVERPRLLDELFPVFYERTRDSEGCAEYVSFDVADLHAYRSFRGVQDSKLEIETYQ